jgi:pentatricopeptide repeat protein
VLAWSSKERASLGPRYADIFSFARQQLRRYSTESPGATLRRTGGRVPDRMVAGRLGSSTGQARDRGKRAIPRRSIRKVVSVWGKVVPWSTEGFQRFTGREEPKPGRLSKRLAGLKAVVISDRRRQGRLDILRKSFGAFQHHESPKLRDVPKIMDGRYRSLRRRILAHSAREAQVLSLDQPLDLLKMEHITKAFAALDRKVYARLNRRSHPIILRHLPDCASWAASLFSNGAATEADQVWRNWNAFDAETREQYWPHLLVYLLDKFPHRVQSFLQALTHRPCVDSLNLWIIADAFEHLARGYLNRSWKSVAQGEQLQQSKAQFIPTFYHVFREHLAPHKRICSQDLLFCVAKLASTEDFQRIFDLMKDSGTLVGHHVLLHYANTFAKAGDFRQALSCLGTIAKGAANDKSRVQIANEKRFRWSCALTLHRSMVNKENYHETTGIVATLVDFGVKLDILLYNVIIHNAMEAGDHHTAFKVYNTLDENGLKPDKITFSTLLHGCTMMADPSKFNDFADYCAETAKEMKDPWLATDYLYYQIVCLHRESRNTDALLARSQQLRQVYLKFFSPRSLEPFWAVGSASSRADSPPSPSDNILAESTFMDPPPVALYIMLQLEILKASTTNKDRVWTLYQKFIGLVQTRYDPVLSKLAKDPIIWNAFLLSFCRAQHFEHASQAVRDMADNGSPPNIYTWNIFMQGFFKTQQINAAERVHEIMRSRGIEPDQFTYEVMLRGYARAQHVRKVGEVMEHVEREKQVDPKLLRDLARVHDQRRVLYELEKARVRREQWMEVEANAKEQREKLRWAPPKFAPLIEAKEKVNDKDGLVIKRLFEPGGKPGLRFGSVFKK